NIHNFEQPIAVSQGVLDNQLQINQSSAIRHINEGIHRLASQQPGVYILDYDGLVARHGRAQWHDERKWLMVRLPIAAHNLNHLANEWLRFLHPLTGKVAKALVVDLDNTLWGGESGADGICGMPLGSSNREQADRALQRGL